MSSSKTIPQLPQAFNDVLAKMRQADVRAGGLQRATSRDTSSEVVRHENNGHQGDHAENSLTSFQFE